MSAVNKALDLDPFLDVAFDPFGRAVQPVPQPVPEAFVHRSGNGLAVAFRVARDVKNVPEHVIAAALERKLLTVILEAVNTGLPHVFAAGEREQLTDEDGSTVHFRPLLLAPAALSR